MPLHFTRLDELTRSYGHVVLSPHLDDAALSCGGLIAGLAAAGQPVLVVNVCTASPGPQVQLSPFAEATHTRWGLAAAEAMAARLDEDEAALEILGADSLQLDQLDAIYRLPSAYGDDPTLFGEPAPGDPLPASLAAWLGTLAQRFPAAIFYAPLGVGRHVDHQLVQGAAAELAARGVSVAFYEDYPYVAKAGALAARLEELGGAEGFQSMVTAIDATMSRKIAAIEAYGSQVGSLFPDGRVGDAVTAFCASLPTAAGACGERIWVRR